MYRGREGMWSWMLHRLTGIGVLLFLLIHILDTALIMLGPDKYNRVIAIYQNPLFRVSEVGLFAAVLYHALNGVRIVIMDFSPSATLYQRRLFWIAVAVFASAMIPVSFLMLSPVLSRFH
jgi:succinate dehydrogenase / fumarate reductase cytochrome b subunit